MLDQKGNATTGTPSSAGQALAGQPQRAPQAQAHDQGARRHHPAPLRQ